MEEQGANHIEPGKREGSRASAGFGSRSNDVLSYMASGMSDEEILSYAADRERKGCADAIRPFIADDERVILELFD